MFLKQFLPKGIFNTCSEIQARRKHLTTYKCWVEGLGVLCYIQSLLPVCSASLPVNLIPSSSHLQKYIIFSLEKKGGEESLKMVNFAHLARDIIFA